jgi:hypothetical protein
MEVRLYRRKWLRERCDLEKMITFAGKAMVADSGCESVWFGNMLCAG